MGMITFAEALSAKEDLAEKLRSDFRFSGFAVSLGSDSCIKAYLRAALPRDQQDQLPVSHNGVPIKYEIVGPIQAL